MLTQAMYSGVVMVMCLQQRSETSCAAPVGAQPASSERQSPPRPAGSPHTASSWPSSLRLLAERHLKIGKCASCTWEFLLFPFNLNNNFATVLDTEWCNQRALVYLHTEGTYKGPATADPAGCCRTQPAPARWTTPGPAVFCYSPHHL